MTGGDGVDVQNGDAGNDTLVGGKGNDTANGGADDDTMTWNNGDGTDMDTGNAGNDTVVSNGNDAAGEVYTYGPGALPVVSSSTAPRTPQALVPSASISTPRTS